MSIRTDLATERLKNGDFTNFSENEETFGEFTVHTIQENNNRHITVTMPNLVLNGGLTNNAENILSKYITGLLPKSKNCVLVCGLGNRDITPDALGPLTVSKIIATRHIGKELAKQINLEGLRPVAAIAPDVLGKTGIEAAELILSVVKSIKPKVVIVIDALCAAGIERLGTTVQLSTAGITPGSGVKNSRCEINEKSLNVPVIAIGIPTVIDATETLGSTQPMVVTPKDIDLLIEHAATVISNAVNISLQPEIESEILRALV